MPKFRYIESEPAQVETRLGVFTAIPDMVYSVKGQAVSDLIRDHRFQREEENTPGEVPEWQSPS